jgi:stress response protein SCP2
MAINLQKGQRISLKKEAPQLELLMCGLGWDVAKRKGGFFSRLTQADFDLDSSVLCLNKRGKIVSSQDVIFYGNLQHSSKGIIHQGDNLTGKGEGDDEEILVNLKLIPSNIQTLVFIVNIYEAISRKQDFSQVKNAFVRLVNLTNRAEIARYSLSGKGFEGKTAMIMAEISRQEDDWEVTAKGEGISKKGLPEIVQAYS